MTEQKEKIEKPEKWEELSELPLAYLEDVNYQIQPGVRIFAEKENGKDMKWYEELWAIFITFFFSGIMPLGVVCCLIGFYYRPLLKVFLLSFLTLLIPAKFYDADVLKSKKWNALFKYFSFSVIFEDGYKPGHVLYAEFPHGVSPMGPLLCGFIIPRVLKDEVYALTTKSALLVPIYHHFLRWMGSLVAGYNNLIWALQHGSCAVVVGGIAEMYEVYPDKEVIFMKTRKGFVRAAVETGVPIRPLYHFGTSQLMELYPRWWQPIARKFKMAWGITVGRWYLPIPNKTPIMVAIGKPIEVKKMSRDDPNFEKYVDEIHDQVMYDTERLYYKYRKAFGYANRPLEIK